MVQDVINSTSYVLQQLGPLAQLSLEILVLLAECTDFKQILSMAFVTCGQGTGAIKDIKTHMMCDHEEEKAGQGGTSVSSQHSED